MRRAQQTAIPQQLVLENSWLRRCIQLTEDVATTAFHVRPAGAARGEVWSPTFWPGISAPIEAAIQVGGVEYEIGPKRNLAAVDAAHRPAAFQVLGVETTSSSLGQVTTVICRPAGDDVPPLEVCLRYELASALPVLVKSVVVTNLGPGAVTVENITVDLLYWMRYGKELHVMTDFYDCYWPVTGFDPYHYGWHRRAFPKGVHLPLAPGESMESFRCIEYVAPDDREAIAVTKHRVMKTLAPWITRAPITQEINDASSYQELASRAEHAAEHGIEMCHFFMTQLFTNCGDFILRPDIFPRGEEDLMRLVAHYHRHGVQVLPYIALTGAWQHAAQVVRDHPDWQYLGPGGIRYNCFAFGNMCYQSDWGPYITGKVDWLLDTIGFDGLHIDCPYHGLPCLEDGHRHPNAESVAYLNWDWERRFFGAMRRRNLFITAPQEQAALLLGTNAMPGGYAEEDYADMGGMPLVSNSRARLYDAKYDWPSCATWAWHAIDLCHGHSIEADDADPRTYEHSLASVFGYGHFGLLHGRQLAVGPNTEAIFRQWIGLYRQYRATFAGEMLHLARPDGIHPDAVLHVAPEADPPALLVAFHPGETDAEITLTLPLAYAGFAPSDAALLDGQIFLALDSRGVATVTLSLSAGEIRVMALRRAEAATA